MLNQYDGTITFILQMSVVPETGDTVSWITDRSARVTFEFEEWKTRRFEWRTAAAADADGLARLRVPYATGVREGISTDTGYRVRVGQGPIERVPVAEAVVIAGEAVRVGARADELERCSEPRPEMCTQDYRPVCAERADGRTVTRSNGCAACADPDVVGYRPGACPEP